MKKRVVTALSMLAGLLLISRPVAAHHSDAVWDQSHLVTVTGTVTKFAFVNPHEQIYFNVMKADGKIEEWVATGGSVNSMIRIGWNRNTFKPGDQVTTTGFPYRDGRKVILHLRIVRNGEEVRMSDTTFLRNYFKRYPQERTKYEWYKD